tara:strand:+ start:77 stop:337 length:261 start_codon:yes stop_codon:yes gene_type:complete
MSPLMQLLKAVRGLGLKAPLRKPALQNLRSAGKGYSEGNWNKAEFHEADLDKIFDLMGTRRGKKAEEVESVLNLLSEMYNKGGGRF